MEHDAGETTARINEEEQIDEAVAVTMSGDILDTPRAGPAAIRGGAMRTAGYVAGVLLSVISAPLLIRHLGVVNFGRYVTVISIIMIVAALADVGLTNIGIREYSVRRGDERRRLIRNLLGMRVVFTSCGVLLAVGFTVLVDYPSVVIVGTLLAGVGLLANVIQGTLQVPLATALKLGWITGLELLRQAVSVALIVALVVAGAALLPFFVPAIVAGLLALACTVPLVRREISFRPAAELAQWWRLVRDALAYAAAAAVGIIYFRIEIVLISLISTGQQTGYFSASFRIVEILAGIPWLLNLSAFPILARAASDDQSRLRYALQRLFEVSTVAGIWVGLVLVIGAPFAIAAVAGKGFGPSVLVLQILGVSMIATFLISTWGFALLSLHRYRALLSANGLALLLALALTFPLVGALGAKGGAIAMAITEFTLAAMYGVLLMRPRRDLRVSLSSLPKVLLACVAAVAVGLLPVPSVIAASLATLVYFGALLLLGAIPVEVLDAFHLRRLAR